MAAQGERSSPQKVVSGEGAGFAGALLTNKLARTK